MAVGPGEVQSILDVSGLFLQIVLKWKKSAL